MALNGSWKALKRAGTKWWRDGRRDQGPYRDFCLLLIEFTGIAIPPLDYY